MCTSTNRSLSPTDPPPPPLDPLSLLSPRTNNRKKKVVAFPTDEDAKKATKAWSKGVPFKGRVTSMDPRPAKGPKLKRGSTEALAGFASQVDAAKKAKGKDKKKGGKQGAGGAGGGAAGGRIGTTARVAPPGTEVLLVVAPKQPELRVRGGVPIFSSSEEAQLLVPVFFCRFCSRVGCVCPPSHAGRCSGGGRRSPWLKSCPRRNSQTYAYAEPIGFLNKPEGSA